MTVRECGDYDRRAGAVDEVDPTGDEAGMNEVGQVLRAAREARGMTVEQVAQVTKVSGRVLHALEEGDRSQLPAPVYLRGFVRAYAVAVGIDPHEVLRLVRGDIERAHRSVAPSMPGSSSRSNAALDKGAGSRILFGDAVESRRGPHASHVVLVLLAIGMFLAAWLISGHRNAPEQTTAQPELRPEIQQRVDAVGSITR
ncbi:MAG: helix-turn-helix domain-containing protein [Deltaproteobacteria bacterium]|nr:helix-turn-helix domain-containing protein [Deltaproteobacteria bacterium]